jgi:hypothetical protein
MAGVVLEKGREPANRALDRRAWHCCCSHSTLQTQGDTRVCCNDEQS